VKVYFRYLFPLMTTVVLGACATSSKSANLRIPTSTHPKEKAVALFKKLIASEDNKEITKQVEAYSKNGWASSNEFDVIFYGGMCKDSVCNYTYQISVDFYKVIDHNSSFKAVSAIISASDDDAANPVVKKVLTSDEIQVFLK